MSFITFYFTLYSVFKVQKNLKPLILRSVILKVLVGSSGLEPPTSRLSGVRSNHLSYEPDLQTLSPVVEMNRIELSTPCLQGRCSPS